MRKSSFSKKMVSIILLLGIFIIQSFVVSASQIQETNEMINKNALPEIDIKEEMYRALNGISDIEISDEIKNSVEVFCTDEMGNEVFVEMSFTTRIISTDNYMKTYSDNYSLSDDSTIYMTTAAATIKTSSDSVSHSPVSATIYLTIYWEDIAFLTPKLIKMVPSWDFYDTTTKMNSNNLSYGNSGESTLRDVVLGYNVQNNVAWDNINYSNFGGVRGGFHANISKGTEVRNFDVYVSTWSA